MTQADGFVGPISNWYEIPPEAWLVRVDEPSEPIDLDLMPWPIEEGVIRREARRRGFLLERLRSGYGYRLWDVKSWIGNCTDPVPVDLNFAGAYVDDLPGIAVFLSCFPDS